tara:strand:+ start:1218 stop:1835 length:618 start_codon:yes stop_codon:yes gene_type:complete
MSIEYLNHALRIEGLPPTKKLILVILGNYADENGSCYPSYKHIAKMIGLQDTKGIVKTIKEFEKLGFLRIEKRKLANGSYTSNRYHLLIGRGVATSRVEVVRPTNTKENTKDIYSDMFEKFWKIYPRKVAKKTASKSFGKIDEKHYKKVLYGASCFAKEKEGTDEQYIPHATTWLNQERYMDWFETDENGYAVKPKKKNLNNLAG